MKKVLVVEDDRWRHSQWRIGLDGKEVLFVSALTISEAEKLFAENPDIVAIIMDACVPGSRLTTEPLVKKFRETFAGPMIAASVDPNFRQMLLRAGCDYESEKDSVSQKLIEVLGL